MSIRRLRHRGLRVTYRHHPGPLTAVALTVAAGARCDGRRPGLAHLAEHMLFQGTANLDQQALNHRAAELGGDHNAETGYEEIVLTFEIFNEDLDDALALLAEQFYRTRIDATALDKEREVVMEEIRGRLDDPADRVQQRAWERYFAAPLAHPICGTTASVQALGPGELRAFLDTYFTHANAVLAVVGGVPVDEVRGAVRRRFTAGAPGPFRRVPRIRRRRPGRVRVKDGHNAQAYFARVARVGPEPHRLLAAHLALDLIGGDADSRLFQELRERRGLCYEVAANLEWGPDWGAAVFYASTAPRKVNALGEAFLATCERAARDGFGEDEVARARKKMRYRYALLADHRLELAHALTEHTLWGFPLPDEAERIVRRLTARELTAEWRRILRSPSTTAVLGR